MSMRKSEVGEDGSRLLIGSWSWVDVEEDEEEEEEEEQQSRGEVAIAGSPNFLGVSKLPGK
jgi:predicted GTPase